MEVENTIAVLVVHDAASDEPIVIAICAIQGELVGELSLGGAARNKTITVALVVGRCRSELLVAGIVELHGAASKRLVRLYYVR